MVKTTYFSCRRPEFVSHHPHGNSQPSMISVPKSLISVDTRYTYTHSKHPYVISISIKISISIWYIDMIICGGDREVRLDPEADGGKLLKIHFIKFFKY